MSEPGIVVYDTLEPVVAQVLRQARDECGPEHVLAADLDACARAAVFRFRTSTVPTYVPLLALRQVRCCIRAGTCNCGEC